MNDINVSFEFFPPKNKESIESLWSNIRRLELFNQNLSLLLMVQEGQQGRTHII